MRSLKDVSFDLYGGEILGVAGVSGSGQRQLCQGLVGLQKISSGEVLVGNDNIAGLSAKQIFEKGVVHLNFVPRTVWVWDLSGT